MVVLLPPNSVSDRPFWKKKSMGEKDRRECEVKTLDGWTGENDTALLKIKHDRRYRESR
jgi:hypothetical protein